MSDFLSTKQLCAKHGWPLDALVNRLRARKLQPPQKFGTGAYAWSPQDEARARAAMQDYAPRSAARRPTRQPPSV
jgi:hypothetical protein